MSDRRLALRGVEHAYESSGFALHVENLELQAGEVVVLTGPSGSGKSTLLALAAGVLHPPTGEVWLGDLALHGTSDAARRRLRLAGIGQVLQDLALIDYLGALENVLLPARLAGLDRRVATERARELLGRLGLGDKLERRPSRLSGGEQQRVALARALVTRPGLVLADEPTGSLDPRTAREAAELLVRESLEAGAAVLFTTHDPSLVDLSTRHVELVADESGPSRVIQVPVPSAATR